MAVKNLTGAVFGILTVLERHGSDAGGTAMWRCRCACGAERITAGTSIRAGRHMSCGCASPRFSKEMSTTHGMSNTRTYHIWQGMKRRCCEMAKGKSRKLYYLKGVRVCEQWREDFQSFLRDMGEAPEGYSIEREDGNGNYEPGNCRWASSREQGNNTSANKMITHEGRTQTVSQWATEIGIKPNTLLYRIRRGWTVSRAVTGA